MVYSLTHHNQLRLGSYNKKQRRNPSAPCATGSPRAGKQKICVDDGGNRMLERIKTFFGKARGPRGVRRTVVEEGTLWRCTQCHLIFITKKEGEQHPCTEAQAK
jgi:hypothetical protein